MRTAKYECNQMARNLKRFIVYFVLLFLKTNLNVYLFFVVKLGKSNCLCGLNSETVINKILKLDPEIIDLQFLVPILPDPTKKGQGSKMIG